VLVELSGKETCLDIFKSDLPAVINCFETNNITRLLDARKVPFQAFELSPEKHSALETARILGVDPSIVFKTIVVVCEKKSKPLLVVIPAPHIVDLKGFGSPGPRKETAITNPAGG